LESALLAFSMAIFYSFKAVSSFPNSSPLLNPVWGNTDNLIHLYTASETNSFHLQINSDGHVDGTPHQTAYSALLIKSEEAGSVVILGVKSGRYLCMDIKGNIIGLHHFSKEDCTFKQEGLENGFDVLRSPKHNILVSLDKTKRSYIPGMNLPPYSQFLSRQNEVALINFINTPDIHRHSRNVDVDPSDPHGMIIQPDVGVSFRKSSSLFSDLPRDSMRTSHNGMDMVDPADPHGMLDSRRRPSPRFFAR
uniref:Fibroblast growth factor 23 n=2 Tax=Latimeria chalumnae TaxID=7897 RepID=H3BF35_LATCH